MLSSYKCLSDMIIPSRGLAISSSIYFPVRISNEKALVGRPVRPSVDVLVRRVPICIHLLLMQGPRSMFAIEGLSIRRRGVESFIYSARPAGNREGKGFLLLLLHLLLLFLLLLLLFLLLVLLLFRLLILYPYRPTVDNTSLLSAVGPVSNVLLR